FASGPRFRPSRGGNAGQNAPEVDRGEPSDGTDADGPQQQGLGRSVARLGAMKPTPLAIAGDPEADRLLNESPLAVLLGMLLDQQVPMEWAFRGPAVLKERLGSLDAKAIVEAGPDALTAAFVEKPALHRFPGSMAKRAYA